MRPVAPPSLLFRATPRTHHVSRAASSRGSVAKPLAVVRLATQATFAELLIDCEEGKTLRAVLVGMLREADRDRNDPAVRS